MKDPDAVKRELCLDIKNLAKGRTAIVGIGNPMRGDDGLGPKLIEILKSKAINASLFDCGTAPENYIFPILSTSPDTVLLVDAADVGSPAGAIKVLGLDEISHSGLSTHNASPRLFADLLKTGKDDLNIFVVSMQPKTIEFGQSLSDEVKAGLEVLAAVLRQALA